MGKRARFVSDHCAYRQHGTLPAAFLDDRRRREIAYPDGSFQQITVPPAASPAVIHLAAAAERLGAMRSEEVMAVEAFPFEPAPEVIVRLVDLEDTWHRATAAAKRRLGVGATAIAAVTTELGVPAIAIAPQLYRSAP